jgi:hypothetical protein
MWDSPTQYCTDYFFFFAMNRYYGRMFTGSEPLALILDTASEEVHEGNTKKNADCSPSVPLAITVPINSVWLHGKGKPNLTCII